MTEGQASKAINPTPTYPAIGRSLEIPGGWKVSKGKKIKTYEAELEFSGGVGGANQTKTQSYNVRNNMLCLQA